MLETKVPLTSDKPEERLKKNEFNEKFRFRVARSEGLVNCASCSYIDSGAKRDETALCQHPERLKKIKIAEYHPSFFGEPGKSENISSQRVCDVYKSKPLPEGVVIPNIPDKHAVLLDTQWRDPYHADPNCPYILEELRFINGGGKTKAGRKGEISIHDLSEMVQGETLRDICEMPCCQNKLPFQIISSNYRRHTGLKPDGTEPRKWVRNGIVSHEKKSLMSPEEAEAFFDLTAVVSKYQDVHDQIIAVSNHLHKSCNWLGSMPLSEAVNPISFSNRHRFWDEPASTQHPEQFWAYDGRLFNRENGLQVPLTGLKKIPEGFILCLDREGFLRYGIRACGKISQGGFWVHGILRPMPEQSWISKGVDYFIDIKEVHYMKNEWWGEFGRGFSGLERFDEE